MIPKKVTNLIDKYCMGIVPSDEQMDEINNMVLLLGADTKETSAYIKKMIDGPTKEEREKAAKLEAEKKAKLEAERKRKEEEKRKQENADRIAREEAERKEREEEARREEEFNKYKSICLEAFDEIIENDSPYEKPSALANMVSRLFGIEKSVKLENARRKYDDALKKLEDLIPWRIYTSICNHCSYYLDKDNDTLFIGDGLIDMISWDDVLYDERRWINKVIILDGIRSINLNGIDNVEYVVLPDSVQQIQECCFANSNLQYLYSSKPLKSIGKLAFAGCKNLKSIYVSKNTKVGENAIYGCDSLPNNILSLLGYYRRF